MRELYNFLHSVLTPNSIISEYIELYFSLVW